MAAANRQRGQVGFKIEGVDHILCYSTNALCVIEEEFNLKDITEISTIIGAKPSIRDVRKLFRIGLSDSEPSLTDEKAGEYIDELGGLAQAGELITRAVQAAFPDAGEGGTSASGPRTRGRSGNGAGSK
ncbi:hypothetical protein [Rhizorhabdus sp.]|uniref:hypothetical protein n=1 Tax=Rhizorhabdus sp. TaxID=1968843 RepID=UPI0035B3DE43